MRGRVDITQLSPEEYWNIVRVITKDIALRKTEQDRIRNLQKQFEETRRAVMLKSTYKGFFTCDEHCLICGANLLTYCCFFYRGAECISCEHVVCPKCRRILLGVEEEAYLCLLCVKKRELKRKSCEWFYETVEKKFKRFGSAKILRAICKQKEKVDHQFVTLMAVVRELSFGSGRKYSVSRPITSLFKEDFGLGSRLHKKKVSRTVSSPEIASLSEAEDVLETEWRNDDHEGESHTKLAQALSLPSKLMVLEETSDLSTPKKEATELVTLSSDDFTETAKEVTEPEHIINEEGDEKPAFSVNILKEVKKRIRSKSETYSQI